MNHTTTRRSTAAFLLGATALALAASVSAATPPKGSSGMAVASGDTVHCYNVNDCKGQSDCKTSASSCKGLNSCKGMGFKAVDAKSCLNKGGTIGDI